MTLKDLVDVSTVVVGGVAVTALAFTVVQWRSQSEQFRQAQLHATMVDYHARIYAATADVIASVTSFARLAEARVQAHGSAVVDEGYPSSADETLDPSYAELLDGGATLSAIHAAHDRAVQSIYMFWLLINPVGPGRSILSEVELLRQTLEGVRPRIGHLSGDGDVRALISSSPVARDPLNTIAAVDSDEEWDDMTRLGVVRQLAADRLRFRVGEAVPAPPIADA